MCCGNEEQNQVSWLNIWTIMSQQELTLCQGRLVLLQGSGREAWWRRKEGGGCRGVREINSSWEVKFYGFKPLFNYGGVPFIKPKIWELWYPHNYNLVAIFVFLIHIIFFSPYFLLFEILNKWMKYINYSLVYVILSKSFL